MSYLCKAYHIFFIQSSAVAFCCEQCCCELSEDCRGLSTVMSVPVGTQLGCGVLLFLPWWGPSVLSYMAVAPLCLPTSRRGVLPTEYSPQQNILPSTVLLPSHPHQHQSVFSQFSVCQLFIPSKLKSPHSKGAYSEHLTAVLSCLIFISIPQLLD